MSANTRQNKWIEAHWDELLSIQKEADIRPNGAALWYHELVDEFYNKFHKSLTTAIEEYTNDNSSN